MDFWSILISVVISSGIVAAIVGGLVTYLSNRKLDMQKRTMETRKEIYTKVNEMCSAFYSIGNSSFSKNNLLPYYREVQIWGSDEVIRCFQNFLKALDKKNEIVQEEKDYIFKEFIISMRRDILGKTNLEPSEINIIGSIE